MIKCKEFYSADRTRTLALHRKHEHLAGVLERINAWIDTKRVKVLNVETVGSGCKLHHEKAGQTIRAWYEE